MKSSKTTICCWMLWVCLLPINLLAQTGSRPISDMLLIEVESLKNTISSIYDTSRKPPVRDIELYWQQPADWQDSEISNMQATNQGEILITFARPDNGLISIIPELSDDGASIAGWDCQTDDFDDIALTWLGCRYTGEATVSEELIVIVNEVARLKAIVSMQYMAERKLPDPGDFTYNSDVDWSGTRVTDLDMVNAGVIQLKMARRGASPAGVVIYTPVLVESDDQVKSWICTSPDLPDINALLDQCTYKPN